MVYFSCECGRCYDAKAIAEAVGIDDFHWRIDWAWGDNAPSGKVVFTLRPIAVNVPFRGTIG